MIPWLTWSAETFARAAREGKPVLLSITAAWCQACQEMDRTTYADPEVVSLVSQRFIPVRVDTDRRPDINERYNLGGWPTTAFLTPDGAIVTGGTFVAADRMTALLGRVAAAFDSPSTARLTAAVPAPPRSEVAPPDVEALIASVFSNFDDEEGGFGAAPRFPHTAPLHLALSLFRETGEERWRSIVERTLDAMAEEGLWDVAGGGFYRYSTGRGWETLNREKLLDTNAELLRVYAESALVFERPRDRDRCRAIAGFITSRLGTEAGGYRGSEADGTLYMDGNARAAGALLGAATVLDDSEMARQALASFERVILQCYKPGAGVAHYSEGVARVRGLLADQIYTAAALLDAHDVSGLEPYKMMAEELTRVAIREVWDESDGGFFDRPSQQSDIGLLRSRRKPFVVNADAVSLLARLARITGDPELHVRAEGALGAAAAQLAGQGPLAAHYLLGRRQLSGRW